MFLGSTGAVWLISLIAVLTLWEFFKLIRRLGIEPFNRVGMVAGAVLCLAPLYLEPLGIDHGSLLALTAVVFAVRILGERSGNQRLDTLAWTLFGIVYIPFMLSFLVRIALISSPTDMTGLLLTVWTIAVAKFCDVGALITGLAIGRHKMAPEISPKKTWEGAVGGILTSAGVGAGLSLLFVDHVPAATIPGIGGVVDLSDSLILTSPIAFLAFTLL